MTLYTDLIPECCASPTVLNVGVLCEFSGIVRDAFIRRGHNAVSCDLLPSEAPGPHIQGDCLEQDWSWCDLLIMHQPCTRLCNSGVRWLSERNLWADMREAATFFRRCLDIPCDHKAAENPVPHKYALEIIGRGYDQIIQPWQFGHKAMKKTCLWLINLPHLAPTDVVGPPPADPQERKKWAIVHRESPGPERAKNRSRTYPGIAEAMAQQWGAAIARGIKEHP